MALMYPSEKVVGVKSKAKTISRHGCMKLVFGYMVFLAYIS
jgi:hypothetical protein